MRRIAAVLGVVLLSTAIARADLIDLGALNLGSPIGSPSDEADFIELNQSLTYDLVYLNKYDYGSGWEGGGAVGSTYFSVDPTSGEPQTADVSWDLTGTGYALTYVLIKDGRTGGLHLYRLYGVTPDQMVIGGDEVSFLDENKAISHISFFGTIASATVPDAGSTLSLLGLALTGLGFLRRKLVC